MPKMRERCYYFNDIDLYEIQYTIDGYILSEHAALLIFDKITDYYHEEINILKK